MPTGVYERKRKAVTSTVKPLIKKGKKSARLTLTIYASNPNGIDMHTFRIRSYGEMIDILYGQFGNVHIHEVRCV